jgi:hypothetical protein
LQEGTVFPTGSLRETVNRATSWARKAIELDPNDAEAHAIAVRAKLIEGVREGSWESILLALQINPNSSWAHSVKGMSLIFNGQPS